MNVYSLPTTTPERPVAILFFLHGRTRSTQDMEPHTFALYEELQRKNAAATPQAVQDLIVVTFVRGFGTLALYAENADTGPQEPRHAAR